MPTKLPRINVTITAELDAALREFRRASGMSAASLLSALLSETVPAVQAMTESFRLAKSAPARAADPIRELARNTSVQIAQLQLDMQPKKRRKLRRTPAKSS